MEDFPKLSRRGFLLRAGGVAAAGPAWPWPLRAMETHSGKIAPNTASPNFNPDVELELICQPDDVSILDGAPTRVWRYVANLVKGPENTLTPLQNSYLGPIMRFATGQKIRIRLRNDLPQATIAHWHGLHVPMLADGHPMAAIDPGETYVYEFEMRNRASMNMYHPHPHEATATQVYRGLAGAIIVNDEEERALGLPSGEYEIPIVIQDRTFNDHNQLVYGGGMHMDMIGFQGERILINGRPNYRVDVASRAYRLRVLNGSNARIYKLSWDDGRIRRMMHNFSVPLDDQGRAHFPRRSAERDHPIARRSRRASSSLRSDLISVRTGTGTMTTLPQELKRQQHE